jgi:hypothetical protein
MSVGACVKGILSGALAMSGVGTALAVTSNLPLSDETVSTGTTSYNTGSSLAVPGTYTYANTFSGATGSTPVPGKTAGFYDDYIFTISGATADSLTSTINLGDTFAINGLQVALFNYTAGQTTPISGSPVTAGWSTAFNSGPTSGTIAVISDTVLAPGSYALEVQGTVAGTAGGSYSGSLNLAPVPLPAALPLLLSGLGAIGFFGRRGRAKQACARS